MKKLALALMLVPVLLAGCASPEYETITKEHEEIRATIDKKTAAVTYSKVSHIKKPPRQVSLKVTEEGTQWLNSKVSVDIFERPLSSVLQEITDGVDVPIYFGENVDPNKPVSITFTNTTQNVLNLLSRSSGYGIQYKNSRIEVTQTLTKAFTLNIPAGTYTGMLGSKGQTGGKESVTVGQYLNVKYENVDLVEQIAKNVAQIVGATLNDAEEGDKRNVKEDKNAVKSSVSYASNLSTITVTTTPDKMDEVIKLINHYQEELSKQVTLNIEVIEFKSDLDTERGIDWDVVKNTGDGVLKILQPGTNLISQGNGFGAAFEATSGRYSGTTALVKVLRKQGTVSTETPITKLVLNEQPAQIQQLRSIPYIYETKTETNDGVTSTSVSRRNQTEGVDMMVVAKVQPEYVWLRISGLFQKIVANSTEVVNDISLGMMVTQKSQINFTNKLRYGQTYVLASVKQKTKEKVEKEGFWTTLFGGTSSRNQTTETLVLLTPTKAN